MFEIGRAPGCLGCDAVLITGEPARPHPKERCERGTKILEETQDGQATFARTKARMDQYHSIISDSVALSGADVIAPPTPVAWPVANEVEGVEPDVDEVEQPGPAP